MTHAACNAHLRAISKTTRAWEQCFDLHAGTPINIGTIPHIALCAMTDGILTLGVYECRALPKTVSGLGLGCYYGHTR